MGTRSTRPRVGAHPGLAARVAAALRPLAVAAAFTACGPSGPEDASEAASPSVEKGRPGVSFLRFPDIHGDSVAFSAGGDLWIASVSGGPPRRLTEGPGTEYFAKFSPDGRQVAYTGHHRGEPQVYVVSVEGGAPRQLTFYPAPVDRDPPGDENQVIDWTPDGAHVVFRSLRDSHWATSDLSEASIGRFFKVPAAGGPAEPLPLAEGGTLSYSGDGESIAFTREALTWNRAWKRYYGGQAPDLWLYEFAADHLEKLTDWKGADHHPMWRGDRIYFVSDRTGTLNLYRLDLKSRETEALTDYRDLDVRWPGFGPEALVFERGGQFYRMGFDDETVEPIAVDLDLTPPPRTIDAAKDVESVALSPSGREMALVARGEIFVCDASGCPSPRNATRTAEYRERDAAFSPDGRWLAFVSDESGQDEVHVMSVNGEDRRAITRSSRFALRKPVWSADGEKIAFHDYDHNLEYVEVSSGRRVRVARTEQGLMRSTSWSPDSRYLAYTLAERASYARIYLFDTSSGASLQVTDGRFNDYEVAFDPSGRFMAFLSARDFEPIQTTRLEWNFLAADADRVFLLMLRPGEGPPLGAQQRGTSPATGVDPAGLGSRLVALPVARGTLSDLRIAGDVLVYRRRTEISGAAAPRVGDGPERSVCAFALSTQKENCVADEGVRVGAGASHVALASGGSFRLIEGAGALEGRGTALRLELRIEPRAEWRQMFREAWRWQWNNHHFRDEKGLRTPLGEPVDWQGLLDRYLPLVDTLTDRDDLTDLQNEIAGELQTGHLGAGTGRRGADAPGLPPSPRTGVLGADLQPDEEGYYRIETILPGENWSERTRSPLTMPGVRARAGDYLHSIDGRPLRAPEDPYRLLEGTLGRKVKLRLSPTTNAAEGWDAEVEPISSATEHWLRYLRWVAVNRRRVDSATEGRVGYIHLPDCSADGLWSFAREWYGLTEKQGVIVDERVNGGGLMAPVFLERIRRIPIGTNFDRTSDGNHTYPMSAFAGRTVMLADKYAGSDGDNLPYFYQKYELGPVIGTRTWGGVVGGDRLTLVDGGYVATANQAVANLEGLPDLENVGVQPDVPVDNLPHEAARGKDAQLDAAIAAILERLGNHP